ncbi:MAG: hypothetical protein ACE5FD_00550 [Anaerolineae bacterium]
MNNISLEMVVKKLLSDASTRKITLRIFLETINQADALGKDKWGTYFTQNCMRLLAGSLIVFTIEQKGIWLALDRTLLETLELKQKALELADCWQWDTSDYPKYTRVPSINGYFTPQENYLEVWSLIKEFHFPYLTKVAHKADCMPQLSRHAS